MEKKFCRALTVCSIQRVPPTRVGTIFLLLPFAEVACLALLSMPLLNVLLW